MARKGQGTALVLLSCGCTRQSWLWGQGWHLCGSWMPPAGPGTSTGAVLGCSCCSSPGTLSSTQGCPSPARTGTGAEEQLQEGPGAQKSHSLTPNLV